MLTITLRAAKEAGACKPAYAAVRGALGRKWKLDTPLPLVRVLEMRGLDDTLWALQCTPPDQADEKRRIVSLWLADILERVQDKMQDERSRAVIPLLREHAVKPMSFVRWERAAAAAAWAAVAVAAVAERAEARAARAAVEAVAAVAAVERAAEAKWQSDRLRFYLSGEKES